MTEYQQTEIQKLREEAHNRTLKMETLKAVEFGADVYDYALAKRLRQIEREEPELITICEAMDPPKDGAARQPYFGCICTAKGRDAIRTLQKLRNT